MSEPLGPDEIRQLLSECVTVVKPGEVLVLRCPEGWGADQAEALQMYVSAWLTGNAPGVRALVVPALEPVIVQPENDAAFLARLEKAWPEMTRREMKRQASNWTPRSVPFASAP